MMDREEKIVTVIMVAVIAACIAMLAAVLVRARREHRRCVDDGGHWEEVGCHQVEELTCTTISLGTAAPITSCAPQTSTSCDSTCVGASAEAR